MISYLFRSVAIILAPAMILYLILLLVSLSLYPRKEVLVLKENDASSSFLLTPDAYLTYASTILDNHNDTVILTGASNVASGFNLNVIEQAFRGTAVHNLALGGAEIDTVDAVIRLVYANRPVDSYSNITFVVGLWFGAFTQQESSHERTRIYQQMNRFGLFEDHQGGYVHVLSRELYDLSLLFLRPSFLAQGVINGSLFRRDVLEKTVNQEDPQVVCDEKTQEWFNYFAGHENLRIHDAQFEALLRLVDRVRARGSRLVLLDMPMPDCLIRTGRTWEDYQSHKRRYLEVAKESGALYLNLQGISNDRFFADHSHLNRVGAERLTDGLVKFLSEIF